MKKVATVIGLEVTRPRGLDVVILYQITLCLCGHTWCQSIWACNDGKKYVTVSYDSDSGYTGWSTQLDQYRGTFYRASDKLVCADIKATRGSTVSSKNIQYLDYITYVYGKYYAILVSGYRGEKITREDQYGEAATIGASRNLYVSTDGITFTRKENFFPSTVYQIGKTNGNLCVYGQTFAGLMSSDETLHYTTLTGNQETGGIVCNKFPRI